jgi:hypothetical protein
MRLPGSLLCISLVAAGASLLAAGAAPARAAAADPIGSAVTVVNMVTAQLARETRTLGTGDAVRQNEIIEVGLDASSELRLKDDTKLALGPGSRLVLDKFVYDPAQSGGSIFINLAKGAFRFVTGVAEKPAYVIRVPAASITVRGTIFDVYVQESGQSWLLLHEGAVRICNDRGTCRDHDEPGKIIPITEGGGVGKPSRWTSLPGVQKVAFDDAFPFVASPPSVDPKPVFSRDDIVGDKAAKPEKPQEANGSDDSPTPPRRQVQAPKIDKGASKFVRMDELKKTELPRAANRDKAQKIMDKVATYLPGLVDRVKERRSSRSSDDSTANSISTRGMFGNGYKKSSPPN